MLPPPATTSTASYAYQPANVGANPGSTSQTPTANNTSRASGSTGTAGATNPSASNTPISGTGASSNPPPTNAQLTSKFNAHDIQVLRQLLVAGEKHKWKQITKEINQTSNNNAAAAAAAAATNSQQSGYGYRNANSGGAGGAAGTGANAGARAGGQSAPKNVSPTFVMKQYQSLLGLPNNSIYFGTLGSSLPYVVAPNGWDDIGEQHYQHHFGDDLE
ncbi:uncharacterized protein SPAPADRAFT_58949 [Spathaspora passalidarum NRRL Y-27907]|uniref:Uncharacterized protein n=1 Tax=Spathaspora passalidarum (strain NRRL Y-27907 / 11-Y1) TaxID=619300 RepID=G3AEF8_SPAPN|nr:uncharacterized protein SPAPADRAFT_58949 [Spathaspora passalidarum NRRL Y-27907]EGW35745.1 hypothetical protein SPAPADRAFT_58949 [Spathaspora passalidarum NRRL Y-27907]